MNAKKILRMPSLVESLHWDFGWPSPKLSVDKINMHRIEQGIVDFVKIDREDFQLLNEFPAIVKYATTVLEASPRLITAPIVSTLAKRTEKSVLSTISDLVSIPGIQSKFILPW